MKVFTVSALVALGMAGISYAQQGGRVALEAYLVRAGKGPQKLFVLGGKPANFNFVQTIQSTQTRQGKLTGGASLYFLQPKEFVAAMDLYEDRKFSEAAAAFGDFAKKYAAFSEFKPNYTTLAGFYELESLRKQFATDELVKKAATFNSKNLTNSEQLEQIEIYKFWELLHAKSWKQLADLCQKWQGKSVADSQRAQIAYCHAVALQGLGKTQEALDAYAVALTADSFKSAEIVNAAALAALDLYLADKEVQKEIKAWGTAQQNKASQGYKLLAEANALARLYNKAGMGSGVDLDARFAPILKCTPSK